MASVIQQLHDTIVQQMRAHGAGDCVYIALRAAIGVVNAAPKTAMEIARATKRELDVARCPSSDAIARNIAQAHQETLGIDPE